MANIPVQPGELLGPACGTEIPSTHGAFQRIEEPSACEQAILNNGTVRLQTQVEEVQWVSPDIVEWRRNKREYLAVMEILPPATELERHPECSVQVLVTSSAASLLWWLGLLWLLGNRILSTIRGNVKAWSGSTTGA